MSVAAQALKRINIYYVYFSIKNYNGLDASELAKSCNYVECSRYLVGAMAAAHQNKPLRGINQELLPPTYTQDQTHTALNGHATSEGQNGSAHNDCDMEMEEEESPHPQANGAMNGGPHPMNGLGHGDQPHNVGLNGCTNRHVNGHTNGHARMMNGQTNGHVGMMNGQTNGHVGMMNGQTNGHVGMMNGQTNGHVGDILLDSSVSQNQALVGGRKRGREDGDGGELKRMRKGGMYDITRCPGQGRMYHNFPICRHYPY